MKNQVNKLLVFMGIMTISTAFSMELERPRKKMQLYVSGPPYPEHTFHFHVTAEKLNDKLLIENNDCLAGINMMDVKDGLTPLHYLIAREDCTVPLVEALLKRGADPTICAKPIINDEEAPRDLNTYQYALTCQGESPEHMARENFSEVHFSGNKEVMRYIFDEILYRKVSIAALQREKKERELWNEKMKRMLRWYAELDVNIRKIIINKTFSVNNSTI